MSISEIRLQDPDCGFVFDKVSCSCAVRFADCVPYDKFEGVMVCDNTKGLVRAECSFKRQVQDNEGEECSCVSRSSNDLY